jgi:hypothetical protein
MAGSHTSLILNFDGPTDGGDNLSNRYEGWFVAPKTTRYRFFVACDDGCQVLLDQTPNSISGAAMIIEDTSEYHPYRQTNLG